MRVAFNATALLSPLTGIGQYSHHLAAGLAAHDGIDAEFFYGAYWSSEVRSAPMSAAVSVLPWIRSHVPFSYQLRRIVQNQRFATHVRRGDFDVYHEPNILPLPFDGPTILTVHDLSWIHYPQMHPVARVKAMNRHFEPGLARASLILTDSEFVKQELVNMFGLAPDSILAVPLGVEPLFHPRSEAVTAATLAQHGLHHGQYLLAVGTLEPRKNLKVALQAFTLLPASLRQRFPLVIVGMKGWHSSSLQAQMAPMLRSGEIRQLGYLSREDLATVIAGALTLIYPSIYEGFGLPPLEAMACGVPVIASNVSSLPEVVGDTGILGDPQDVDALAGAIAKIANNPQERQALSERALARSRQFTWGRCIETTIGAYRRVVRGQA